LNNMEKEKAQVTWLQATLPKADWENINVRRLALNLRWGDIVVPAVMEYLPKLEAAALAKHPETFGEGEVCGAEATFPGNKPSSPAKKTPGKKAPKADKPLVATAEAAGEGKAQDASPPSERPLHYSGEGYR
jgi:hypothetical protein